ncbi:ornithine carbamoyltransferase [Thalassotalea ganghwensis]
MSFVHFLADDQFGQAQLLSLIELAKTIKSHPNDYAKALAGKSVVMLFEKPSLRTHVSFDVGINKLGGHALYLGQQNGKLGERERISDYAKNLSCYADAIVARVFHHDAIKALAEHASVPVINALCDKFHPCQALADFVTLSEHFTSLENLNFAYVGDGNNVSNSLMLMAAILGVNFTLVCPQGYGPDQSMIAKAKAFAQQSGASLSILDDIKQLKQQDVIYTDTWLSMGSDATLKDIAATFMPFQVNHQLMAQTGAKYVMHCQPAHLEQEITTELFDSEMAVVFEQAENRMWAQNAVLVSLLS